MTFKKIFQLLLTKVFSGFEFRSYGLQDQFRLDFRILSVTSGQYTRVESSISRHRNI